MPAHVAILRREYLNLILDGTKTIESRFSRNAVPPFGLVSPGDLIHFKVSAGPFLATATASHVTSHSNLTPPKLDKLRQRYNTRICAPNDYWLSKQNTRYATLIHLTNITPTNTGPDYPKNPYRAWFVLPDTTDAAAADLRHPVPGTRTPRTLNVPLTAGALRNHYLTIASADDEFFPASTFSLLLPDDREVHTTLYRTHRLRWRGWAPYFAAHQLAPGDVVRFVRLKPDRYRVTFHPRKSRPRNPRTAKPRRGRDDC